MSPSRTSPDDVDTTLQPLGFPGSIPLGVFRSERLADDCSSSSGIDIKVVAAKTDVQRDEIFDVTISTDPSDCLPLELTLDLDITPDSMKTQTLGARGSVQMYDFGTVGSGGAVTGGVTSIVLKASENYTKTIKAVLNQEGTGVQIHANSLLYNANGMSDDISVTTRMRQYAEKEESDYDKVNAFDDQLNGAAGLWSDWGYGDSNGNYTFKDGPSRYDGELLKAVCFKESYMNADEAEKHSTAEDLMQVDGGNQPATPAMNGTQYNWNGSATPITVTDTNHVQHQVYKVVETPSTVNPGDNFAWVPMHYSAHSPPGPASVNTNADSFKWAIRELLYKQYSVTITSINVLGQGPTEFVLTPPTVKSLSDTLNAYGTGSGYYDAVIKIRDQGIGPTDSEYCWPIKTDKKARH